MGYRDPLRYRTNGQQAPSDFVAQFLGIGSVRHATNLCIHLFPLPTHVEVTDDGQHNGEENVGLDLYIHGDEAAAAHGGVQRTAHTIVIAIHYTAIGLVDGMAVDPMQFPDHVLYRLQALIMRVMYHEYDTPRAVKNQLLASINGMSGLPGFYKINDRGHYVFVHNDGRWLVPYRRGWYLAVQGIDPPNLDTERYHGTFVPPPLGYGASQEDIDKAMAPLMRGRWRAE